MMERIEGVPVCIFGVAKTIADCFRYRRTVGQSIVLEGLQEALRQRKAAAAEIARCAGRGGVIDGNLAVSRSPDGQWLV